MAAEERRKRHHLIMYDRLPHPGKHRRSGYAQHQRERFRREARRPCHFTGHVLHQMPCWLWCESRAFQRGRKLERDRLRCTSIRPIRPASGASPRHQEPGTCSSTVCNRSLSPDWYGTATVTLDTVCSNCHAAPIGTVRRQIMGTAGDFATSASVTSHHVAGGDPTPAQCTVCHDQSLRMGGTVRLTHADAGTRVDDDPANPSTLDQFCLSCHDADGALATAVTASALSPFNDGVTLGTMPHRPVRPSLLPVSCSS
jgi:hypothetical protein